MIEKAAFNLYQHIQKQSKDKTSTLHFNPSFMQSVHNHNTYMRKYIHICYQQIKQLYLTTVQDNYSQVLFVIWSAGSIEMVSCFGLSHYYKELLDYFVLESQVINAHVLFCRKRISNSSLILKNAD